MKKTLTERAKKKEETKAVQADIALSKRNTFIKNLEKNDQTMQSVIEAAVDQYNEENEAKR